MLSPPSARKQPWGLTSLLLTLISILGHPSHAYILPMYFTDLASRKPIPTTEAQTRKPPTFTRDFATAMGAAVAVVVAGATLLCVFAHCWRQILDRNRSRGRESEGAGAKRGTALLGGEEAWFCRADRRLSKPLFEDYGLEPAPEPMRAYSVVHQPTAVPEPCYGYGCEYSRVPAVVPRLKSKPLWHRSEKRALSESIERPPSVACLLDRP